MEQSLEIRTQCWKVGTIAAAAPSTKQFWKKSMKKPAELILDFDDQLAWIWIVRGGVWFTFHFYAILYLLMGTVLTVTVSILVMWKHHSDLRFANASVFFFILGNEENEEGYKL